MQVEPALLPAYTYVGIITKFPRNLFDVQLPTPHPRLRMLKILQAVVWSKRS